MKTFSLSKKSISELEQKTNIRFSKNKKFVFYHMYNKNKNPLLYHIICIGKVNII